MADKKISQLPALTGVTKSDTLVVVSNGTTYKVPVSGLTTVFPSSTTTEGYVPVLSGGTFINSLMHQTEGGILIGSDDEDTPLNPDKLGVYAGITNSYNLISAHGTIDNYLQVNIQNKSSGGFASTDIVATKNDGNETTGYIDMGINSSTYTATTFVGGPNDAYLYSTGARLYIGNASPNSEVVIFNGGLDAVNEAKVFIHDNGTVAINTNTNDDQNPAGLRVFSPTSTSYNLIYGQGEIDNYSQFNIKNVNGGISASTDIVATNNIGSETSYYIDMGINSSNYAIDPNFSVGGPNDTYLLSVARNHYIGSSTSGDIKLFTGSNFNGDTNAKLILTANSGHTINGNLLISGGTTLNGAVTLNAVTSGTTDTKVLTVNDAGVVGYKNESPYRVYTAILTQTGSTAPTANVLENSIGTLVYSRTGTGSYEIASPVSAFTVDKTVVFTTANSAFSSSFNATVVSTSVITIAVRPSNDNVLVAAPIEIRIYN